MIGGKIWNILYEAKKQGVERKNIKFKSSGIVSPYMELNFENLNFLSLEKEKVNEIDINPYYRYFDIFMPLLDKENIKNNQLIEILFNAFSHLLGEVEMKKGITKEDYYLKFLEQEIKEFGFGKIFCKEFYELFTLEERKELLSLILYTYRSENLLEYFFIGLKVIFKNSISYVFKEEKDIILYISNKKDNRNEKKLEILKKLFLPLGIETIVFWEYHFAVIDNDDTCIIDEISIF